MVMLDLVVLVLVLLLLLLVVLVFLMLLLVLIVKIFHLFVLLVVLIPMIMEPIEFFIILLDYLILAKNFVAFRLSLVIRLWLTIWKTHMSRLIQLYLLL
ncbi:hypothetical protein AQUCO_04500171v1 [Aquilegia coerulea]|uniref:Uncharacterized protein n=1 Tax=Aquilegia coerulea TaxID=218851 RepID=A0A2G5CMB1_AQUCA|nr:hypothetical protein AQUCO_04500171v1 [Aquilegia coerulea]